MVRKGIDNDNDINNGDFLVMVVMMVTDGLSIHALDKANHKRSEASEPFGAFL